jgi:hypothetical protein
LEAERHVGRKADRRLTRMGPAIDLIRRDQRPLELAIGGRLTRSLWSLKNAPTRGKAYPTV